MVACSYCIRMQPIWYIGWVWWQNVTITWRLRHSGPSGLVVVNALPPHMRSALDPQNAAETPEGSFPVLAGQAKDACHVQRPHPTSPTKDGLERLACRSENGSPWKCRGSIGCRGGRAVVWSLVCHVNLFRLRWLLLYRFLACVHVCKRITMYHASPMHPLPNVFVYKQPDGRKKYMVWRVLPKKETNGLNVFCLPTSTKTQPGDCVPT